MHPMPLLTAMVLDPGSEGTVAKEGSGAGKAPTFVEISIAFDADGTPSAQPDSVEVLAGGTITWRSAPGETTPFQILPKLAWEQGHVTGLRSHPQGDCQLLTCGASSVPGTYHYGIEANGKVVDPDIIIKPAR